jgi:signal transduction protein with GAF and PtsI domain
MADRDVLQSLVDLARAIFRAQAASVALLGGGALTFKAVSGRGEWMVGVSFAAGEGIAGGVATTGEPVHVPNVDADDRFARDFAERTGYVPREMVVAPLARDGRIVGVISVLDPGELHGGTDTLIAFASIAVLALE